MKKVLLIFSFTAICWLFYSNYASGQEIENIDELYFAHDFYNVKQIYFLSSELSLGLQFKGGNYDVLFLNSENLNQKEFKIIDLFEDTFNGGRIRLYDVWRNNDSTFILSTAMGDFEMNSSEISVIKRDFNIISKPFADVYAYNTPFLTIGYSLMDSKLLKRKYCFPQFEILTQDSTQISFAMPAREFETSDTYFDLKNWNIFYDRDRLFTPFIDMISDKEVLINYPKFNKATYFHYDLGRMDFFFDTEDIDEVENFYLFYDSQAKYFVASVKTDDKYKLYLYDKRKHGFTYWDSIEYQPLGVNSVGVYYQIKVPKGDKVNHYIKRYEKLSSFKVLLEEITVSPDQ